MSTTPTYDPDVDKPVEDMLKRASARAEKSLQERNAAILLAFAEGASLREIGQAANMTLDSTWRRIPAARGYLKARHAPEHVQDAAARWLWNGGRGCSHWSAC